MKDELGDRMKDYYESRTKFKLIRRIYTLIRIDGKAFHTFTKGFERPFSTNLINIMDDTAIYLCANIQGAKFAFVQSDEITILLTDFDQLTTDAWYDGNVQKIVSISASLATGSFNANLNANGKTKYKEADGRIAFFDSRVFQIPTKSEVENCFIWRQQDTVRNSIQAVAQSLYSHKELNNKNSSELQDMIIAKGQNWNDYPVKQKRGRMIIKENYMIGDTMRSRWISSEPPIFTQEREYLSNLIPENK